MATEKKVVHPPRSGWQQRTAGVLTLGGVLAVAVCAITFWGAGSFLQAQSNDQAALTAGLAEAATVQATMPDPHVRDGRTSTARKNGAAVTQPLARAAGEASVETYLKNWEDTQRFRRRSIFSRRSSTATTLPAADPPAASPINLTLQQQIQLILRLERQILLLERLILFFLFGGFGGSGGFSGFTLF